MIGIGIDSVEVDRFRVVMHRRPGILDRLFTDDERRYAERRRDPTERFAARFAAKEAVMKALGVGVGACKWREIEVVRAPSGAPSVRLHGGAARLGRSRGVTGWQVSLTHTHRSVQAVAVVVGGVVIPIVTPAEMGAIDRAVPEPVEVLVERAGAAVAREALDLLGGGYGRRTVVLAGKGNNGADGRSAARRLRRRGVRTTVVDAADALDRLPPADLVVDAAYGTGFRGTYEAPDPPPGAMVLAVDIPSGVDGLTGEAGGRVLAATRTVTFAALKPGLLLGRGPELTGEVRVADIGLDASSASAHLVEAADVAAWIPRPRRDAHKWRTACWVVAGSPGMTGAARLCAGGAQRAGAGYVRLSSPGVGPDPMAPTEVVSTDLPDQDWAEDVLGDLDRFAALAVGPGLGTAPATVASVRRLVAGAQPPVVVDGDGLTALATGGPAEPLRARSTPAVLTPHDGELARLTDGPPGADRLGAVRALASTLGAVVLAKGPTTVVADPGGSVLVTTSGDASLATAGTGDVLTGVIVGLLAAGVAPMRAAAAGAHLHGRAGALACRRGLVAGDLIDHLPATFAELPE